MTFFSLETKQSLKTKRASQLRYEKSETFGKLDMSSSETTPKIIFLEAIMPCLNVAENVFFLNFEKQILCFCSKKWKHFFVEGENEKAPMDSNSSAPSVIYLGEGVATKISTRNRYARKYLK